MDGESCAPVAGRGESRKRDVDERSCPKVLSCRDLGERRRQGAKDDKSAPWRTRTSNPLIKSQMLCQLS